MILKKGMQIDTKTMANGQNFAGASGIFVMPNTDVTKVSGCSKLALPEMM